MKLKTNQLAVNDELNPIFDEIEASIGELKDSLQEKITLEDIPEVPEVEFPTEFAISNLPEVQKVEVINFPTQQAPIVNIEASKAPIVNVSAPIVEMNNEEVVSELQNIATILSKEEVEKVEQTEIIDKDGKIVNFKDLFDALGNKIGSIHINSGGVASLINLKNMAGLTVNPATEDRQMAASTQSSEEAILLRRMVKIMESLAVTDINKRQRIAVESVIGTSLGTSIAVPAAGVGAVNVPTSSAPIVAAAATFWQPVWIGPVDQRYVLKDQARNTYNNGIRNQLSFT